MNILVLSALVAVCTLLAAHPRYPDGLVGRCALAVIVLICSVMVIGEARGKVLYDLSGGFLTLLSAINVFLYRHAYRFLLWAHFGKHSWSTVPRQTTEVKAS